MASCPMLQEQKTTVIPLKSLGGGNQQWLKLASFGRTQETARNIRVI
jgi:hypothetical protein